MTVSESLSSQQQLHDENSKKLLEQQQEVRPYSPNRRVPLEVWEHIFGYLYPSQLSRLSMVSKAFETMISSLAIWSRLFVIAHDPHIRLRLLGGVPESKSFMLYICATSLHVCEQCFCLTPFDVENSSHMPLPVLVPLPTRSTVEIKYVGERINLSWKIRLCLECRRIHFSDFEERLPHANPPDDYFHIDQTELRRKYPASRLVPVLDSQNFWTEREVWVHMREYFGGSVGVKASTIPSHVYNEKTEKRIEWYQLQD